MAEQVVCIAVMGNDVIGGRHAPPPLLVLCHVTGD